MQILSPRIGFWSSQTMGLSIEFKSIFFNFNILICKGWCCETTMRQVVQAMSLDIVCPSALCQLGTCTFHGTSISNRKQVQIILRWSFLGSIKMGWRISHPSTMVRVTYLHINLCINGPQLEEGTSICCEHVMKLENSICEAQNFGSTCVVQLKSQNAPQSPWRDLSGTKVQEIAMKRTINGVVRRATIYF